MTSLAPNLNGRNLFRMRRIDLCKCFVVLAGFVLLVGLTSCADGSSIPEPSPEPMPEPVPVAPYLEVTPDTLRFDVAGNALNAEGFSVRTNCAW